jgi:hypothetical protein
MAEQWNMKGQYMEACTCDPICPCITLSDPTAGTCTAVVGWHIDQGKYGGADLSGLNVVVALHSPGNMAEGNFKVALLIDDRASKEQQEAIGAIWGGQAGGHLGEIAKLISDVAGMETVPLAFETDGKTKGVIKVGSYGGAEWEALEGQGGGPVTVEGHQLAIAPGFPVIVSRASKASFDGFGIQFSVENKQAMMSPFDYAGP